MVVDENIDILLVEDSKEEAALATAAITARNLGQKLVHVVDIDQALELVCATNIAASSRGRTSPK